MSTGDRVSRLRMVAVCLAGMLLALLAPPGTAAQAPPAAPSAGKISTLIPVDSVIRERKPLNAAKDMPLFWGDVVKTEKGGRVRVQLNDGSVLNVGSQSSVVIQRHDAGAQQTDLQLIYGQIRSDVVKIVQPGGGFNVRTTAAVAGVIGTQEYLEATDILTTVIALGGGNVIVRSTDPRYSDTVVLAPGEALTAVVAHPLGKKRPATQQELQKAFEATEAGPIATLQAPAQAAPGQTVQTLIAGKGLATTTGVTSTQPGIQVQISGTVTATQIPVIITVANNVPTGTYQLIVSRPEGVLRALLVVSSLAASGGGGGAGGPIQPPSSQSFTVNQGTKLTLDASSAGTPSGTQIIAYQWQVTGTSGTSVPASATTQLSSSQSTFLVNSSLLPLGNYTIQLGLVNSSGQSATQQYPLTVVGVPQPQDVIAQVAIGYESLQPAQFLKNFDEQRFANYASFAQAVQDSFTTKLASVRVFQRPATCTIVQEQDTAVCQVDFQVQFTLQNEPSVFINSSGNPVPAGTPGATLGKPIESGTEHATLRFYRSDSGWKIVDYTATVSCPGGGTSSGVNVGSCILAIGSSATPSFSLTNLQLPNDTNVTAGSSSPASEGAGTVTGQFDVVPAGGFNGSVTLTAQPSIPGVTVAFNPSGPVSSGTTVNFTVSATASVPPIPSDFNGTLPFTVVMSGRDGALNSTLSVPLTLRADYSLSATSPVTVTPGGSVSIPVQVVVRGTATPDFNGNVTVGLLNPPAGFSATPVTVAGGATGNLVVQVAANVASVSQPLTIQGTLAAITRTTTATVNVQAGSFALQVAPATSANSPVNVIPTGTLPVQVSVVPLNGFTGNVTVSVHSNNEFAASPITVAADSSGTLTVFVSAVSGGLGPQQFVIQGTSGSLVQTSTVFVNVLFPFTLNVTPATTQSSLADEAQGSTFTVSVQLVPVLGSSSSATVSLSGPSSFVFPSSLILQAGATGNFPVQVSATAPLGPATITVNATVSDSSLATQSSVFVNVTTPPLFQIQQSTSNTSPLMLAAGSSASLPVSIVLSGSRTLSSARSLKPSATTLASATMQTLSFSSAVTLNFGPLPQGVSVQPATATLVPGGTQTFTFSFTPGTVNPSFGSADVTLTALAPGAAPVQTQIVLDLVPSPNASFSLSSSTAIGGPVVLTLPAPLNPTTFFLNVSPSNLNQPVTVSFSQLPAGVSVNPATLTSLPTPSEFGNLGPFQFLANPSLAVPGSYTVMATATSGGQTATTTVGLQIEGSFSLSVSPTNTQASPLVLPPDGATQTAITVTATSISNFSGPVTVFLTVPFVSVSVSPGTSQSINVPAGGSAQAVFMLVAAKGAASTQPAAATSGATSSNGPALNSVTGPFLAIGPGNFNASLSQSSVTLVAGSGDTTITVQVTPVAGFTGPVCLSVNSTSLPVGLEINPMQETLQAGGQGQLFLHARGISVPGNFPNVEIDVSAGPCPPSPNAVLQRLLLNLTIQGQISLNVTDATGGLPGTQTSPIILTPLQGHSFNVQVGGNNGYSGTTLVTVQNIDPNGLTITFGAGFTPTGPNTATINAPATGTLTLTAGPPPGLTFNFEQINVQASSPNQPPLSSTSPSQTIFITGTVTGFILGCDRGDHAVTDCANLPPLTLNINQAGSAGILQLRADSVGNLKDPIKVVPVGLPPGVTMTPSSLIITPQNALAGTDTPVTFTAASPATAGSFTFSLMGTDTVNTSIPPSSTTVRVTLNGSIQVAVASPASSANSPVLIPAGGSQGFTVNVTGQNGFSGQATITAAAGGLDSVMVTPASQTVTVASTGSVQALFTVTALANAPPTGSTQILFDSSSTASTYSVPGQTNATGYVAVGPTSFSMQVLGGGATLAQPLTVQAGLQGSSSVQIDPVGGFTGTVTLDVIGLPPGFFAQFFAPNSTGFKTRSAATLGPPLMQADYPVTGSPFIAPFQIFAPSGGPAGVVQATLTATSGTIAESMPLVIYVVPQVTLSLTPAANGNTSALIPPGGSIPLQVSVGGAPNFAGAVDLAFQPVAGLTVTPPTVRVNVGGSVTVNVAAGSNVAPGTQLSVQINASINGIGVTGTFAVFSVGSGTFNISVSPASASSPATPLIVAPGGSPVNVTVTPSPISGFTSPVTITAAFSGDSGFLSTPQTSQTVNPGQAATFPVSAAAGAPPLTATMFFSATSGSLRSFVEIFVTTSSGSLVLTPFFSFLPGGLPASGGTLNSANPLLVDINSPSPAALGVSIVEQQNFSGPVTLTATNLPSGLSISPNNVSVPPNSTLGTLTCFSVSTFLPGVLVVSCETFALTASPQAAPGDTQLTVTATTSGIASPVSITVPVRVRGNYSLAVSPGGSATSPVAIVTGTSQQILVSVVSQSTFPASSITVTPDMKSLPAGVTISPASAAADSKTPATFTLTAAAGLAPTGELAINFASSTPFFDNQFAPFPTTTLFYTVGSAPTFNMTVAPQAGTILGVLIGDPGGNTEFVTLTPVGGFTGSVSILVQNLPAGVHANPAATIVNVSGTSVSVPIIFTADSTVQPLFTQAVTITATAAANAFVTSKSGTPVRQPGIGSEPALTVPINLNLVGDYRLQPQGTGQTQGSGSSASDPVILPPPSAGSLPQSFNFNLFVNAMDNFSGTVNLAATGSLPAGVTASITPTATPTTPGTLTITVPASVASSPVFPITITATSTSASTNPQKLTFFFEVASATTPSISLIVPSTPVVVGIGSNQFTTFQIGFTGFVGGSGTSPLNLTIQSVATTVPPGVTFSPTIGQASVHGSVSATGINLQVRADPPASAGAASVTVQATVTDPATGGVIATGSAPVQLDLQGSYTLTTTPATSPTLPGVLAPGQSITFAVNAIGPNFSSPVTLTLNNQSLPGVSVSPTTLTVTPGTPAQFTVSASASAPPAAITQISFQSNAAHATSSPTLPLYLVVGPASFSFTTSTFPISPAGVMINGGPTAVTANFISLGGSSGSATLTAGPLPAGLTVSPQSASGTFSPNNNQNSINFTFQADQRLPQGPLNVPVTFVSNGQSITGFFYLYIISNLALTQNPATSFSTPLNLTSGAQSVTISLQSQGGVNTGQIPLSISAVPSGITVTPTPNPPTISGGGSASLSITAGSQAAMGLQSFFVQASFAGVTAQTTVWVFVGTGDFLLATTPNANSGFVPLLTVGGPGAPVVVSVQPLSGFAGSVTITANTSPSGLITVSPPSATVLAGQSTTFTLAAVPGVTAGSPQVTFSGTSGNLTRSAPVLTVEIVSAPFTVSNVPSITLEQGNLAPVPATITLNNPTNTPQSASISFGNLPQGVNVSPATQTVLMPTTGSVNASFTIFADATSVVGQYAAQLIVVSGSGGMVLPLSIQITTTTSGVFLTTNPATSQAAPLLLQPDATLVSFVNINVNAKGGFAGPVSLAASNVPAGVTATLVPASADLTSTPLQVLQLQFRTSTGMAAFGPAPVLVSATNLTSGGGSVVVFVALQTVSSITKIGNTSSRTAPQVTSAVPASGTPGSYTIVTVLGKALSGISSVLADSPLISGKLEPGATDQRLTISVFVNRGARRGEHALMLVGRNGSLPLAFQVVTAVVEKVNNDGVLGRRLRLPGAGRNSRLDDADDIADLASTTTAVASVTPPQLQPGVTMEATLAGTNLAQTNGIRISGTGIRAEILRASDSELQVRFTVDVTALPGSRILTIQAGNQTATALVNVAAAAPAVAPAPRQDHARLAPSNDDSTIPVAAVAVPRLQVSDITMTPLHPRLGDIVTFSVGITNESSARASAVPVEFSIAGTNARSRQALNLEPGQGQTLEFEWRATQGGRFTPRVVLDPDNTIPGLDRSQAASVLSPFELTAAGAPTASLGQPASFRERARLSLTLGGCTGLRLASGSETSCSGAADVSFRLPSSAAGLRIEADGVRNLGMVPLEQINSAPAGALASADTVLSGFTYLVQAGRQTVALRVIAVRGLESLRNAPPAPLRAPRLDGPGGFGRPPLATVGEVTVMLEWKTLPQR